MNVELLTGPKNPNQEDEILDAKKMMNINEQKKHFLDLLKYINTNKEKENKNKETFDLDVLKRYDGKVIRKLINLMLEQRNRGQNALYAINILNDLENIQKNNLDVKPVLQKHVDLITDKYMYQPNGGKAEFENKIKQTKE